MTTMTKTNNSSSKDIIPARFRAAKAALNQKYKITDYAEQFGISIAPWGQQTCCPFHDDSTPSFSVDPERNIFNCFGCGRGGTFVDFYISCQEKFKDHKLGYYAAVQELLREDTELQAALGFSNIYQTYEEAFDLIDENGDVDEELLAIPKAQLRPREITMKHVMDKVKTLAPDIQLEFIADCEKGATQNLLIRKYYKGERQDPIVSFEMSDDVTSMFAEAVETET